MRLFFILILSIPLTNLLSQTTIFVNQNASGGIQNGSDWANAFTDLQQALNLAAEGDAIWVAKGTYYPTDDNDRTISFVLKQGVKMLGGFLGNEQTESLRDFVLNETILSGNIGQPDGSDNSSHVLRGEGLDSTTVLDGFVVRHGNADSPGEYGYGGGLLLSPSQSVYNTCPIVQNCRFEHNYAFQGGAISADRIDDGYYYVNPIIRNCQFFYNRASGDGGGISKTGPALSDRPFIIENCIFEKNSSFAGFGGGIHISDMYYDAVFKTCSFSKDSAKFGIGGAVFFETRINASDGSNLIFEACTFSENISIDGGGVMVYANPVSGVSGTSFKGRFSDCVFTKNVSTNGSGGAYYLFGFDKIYMTVDAFDCKFIGNRAYESTIAHIQGSSQGNVKIHIRGCEYYDNRRLGNPTDNAFPILCGLGGSGGELNAVIENCLFSGNGGGISTVRSGNPGKMNTLITNCTFYNNTGIIINKSVFLNFDWINNYVITTVRNSVIWEPAANLWSMFGDNNATVNFLNGYAVDHNLLSLDSFQASPFGPHNILHKEPLFVDAANRDFRLLPCSPGVNAGENIVVDTLGLAYDLDGKPRKTFGTVDMGAYEAQDSCFVSSSHEPLEPDWEAVVWPNPVAVGEKLVVDFFGHWPSEARWQIWDSQGRVVSAGEMPLNGLDKRWLPAPNRAGVYLLKVWDGQRAIVKKVEVLP